MALNALNSTTTSGAIDAEVGEFAVASTSSISVGQMLVAVGTAGQEAMKVQAIPVSGRVQVKRGVDGTRALAHKSGTKLWIGAHDAFKRVSGQSPNPYVNLVGNSGSLLDYALPGTKAIDGAGNEYVMVDLTFAGFVGAGVLFDRAGAYTAAPLASGNAGSVGVLVEDGTSDQWVWAQVYGLCDTVQLVGGSSLVTSTGIFQPATSVSSPAVGILGRTTSQASSEFGTRIFGMYPTSAVTTATTSASSATGFRCSAWLHYPFVEGRQPSS
jgi:hypothetical protein